MLSCVIKFEICGSMFVMHLKFVLDLCFIMIMDFL